MNLSDLARRLRTSKYAETESFELYEWHYQLERRIGIASRLLHPEFFPETKAEVRGDVEELRQHPLGWIPSDFLNSKQELREHYKGAKNASRGTSAAARFLTLGEFSRLRECIDSQFLEKEEMISNPFVGMEEAERKVTDCYYAGMAIDQELIIVDLNAPKEHLLKAVESLLVRVDRKDQSRSIVKFWYSWRLLQAMDLMLFAWMEDFEWKPLSFARLIARGAGGEDGADPEIIRKSTLPLAADLLKQNKRGVALMKRLRLDASRH